MAELFIVLLYVTFSLILYSGLMLSTILNKSKDPGLWGQIPLRLGLSANARYASVYFTVLGSFGLTFLTAALFELSNNKLYGMIFLATGLSFYSWLQLPKVKRK